MTEQQKTQIHRLSTALLVLGVSGSGKTSLLETLAVYLWETKQKVLLLYSWDGGAIPTGVQKRIHQGLIRFWRCRTRSAAGLAIETLALATKGYWPRKINPQTGETDPAVELVSPITTKYTMFCPQGHVIKVVPAASLIKPSTCSVCNKTYAVAEMTTKEAVARTRGFEQVGGVAYDGLTSMTNVIMDDMDRMRGQGHIGGEKSSFGGVIISGDSKFGGNNRADVGFAQTRAQQFVANSLSIPFLDEAPVFTGLSTEGSDKGGLTVIGVDLPGQAALTQAPQWFGNIVEADSLVDDDGKKHFVLHTAPFTDKEGRRHLLKTSSSPWGVPQMLVDPAEDARRPFEQFNLGVLLGLLDEDLRKAGAEELSGAPGMPDGLMEYGEPAAVETPGGSPVAGLTSPSVVVGTASSGPSQGVGAGNPGVPAARGAAVPGRARPVAKPGVAAAQPAQPAQPAAPAPPNAAPPAETSMSSTAPAGVSSTSAGAAPPPPGRPPMRAPGS